MTKKSYRTLRKKLQELEAELHFFYSLSLSLSPEIAESHRYFLASEIQQHFLFANNLLKAEIDSTPSNPQYLHRIARRLSKIEASFRNKELSSPPVDSVSSSSSSADVDVDDDAYSDSSSELDSSEKGQFKENMTDGEVETKGKGRLFVFKFLRFCGVFMSGVIFGTILTGMGLLVEFSDPFISSAVREGFLIPT